MLSVLKGSLDAGSSSGSVIGERFSNRLIGWLIRNHNYQLLSASLQFSNCIIWSCLNINFISTLYIGLLMIEHEKKQLWVLKCCCVLTICLHCITNSDVLECRLRLGNINYFIRSWQKKQKTGYSYERSYFGSHHIANPHSWSQTGKSYE